MNSSKKVIKINSNDNVAVALIGLERGERVTLDGDTIELITRVKAKHKFTLKALKEGDPIYMYGVLVGKALSPIEKGAALTVDNTGHAADDFALRERKLDWTPPASDKFKDLTFKGFHRANGEVGTANHWIVIPMVFCENRNVGVMKEAFESQLGLKRYNNYISEIRSLINLYGAGKTAQQIKEYEFPEGGKYFETSKVFPNVDGVKFLNHDMGCGGTRADSDALCGLLAGYITHPNVAGATVLSLGCQHAQISILKEEIKKRDPAFEKPLVILEQQKVGSEEAFLRKAIKYTFAGLMEANQQKRSDAPLSKLCVGLECGGSDGFSGISANPAVGYVSDLIIALGGKAILSEFPELCGVEQELSDRCVNEQTALRFMSLMKRYNEKAELEGSGFYMNPSPGNIRDGLITDAIKSAGAARKGGSSPVVDVLDYPEICTRPGLNLLCTPGNDVESTTAEVGAWANIVLFTTGLGTPTGNPIAPVIKIASNTNVFEKMRDIIDINAGTIIEGKESIEEVGERILEHIIRVASGDQEAKAVALGQDDFIPWRRGISL